MYNMEWGDVFICENCDKENFIKPDFKAYKKEGK
jgi:hypothetical protein